MSHMPSLMIASLRRDIAELGEDQARLNAIGDEPDLAEERFAEVVCLLRSGEYNLREAIDKLREDWARS